VLHPERRGIPAVCTQVIAYAGVDLRKRGLVRGIVAVDARIHVRVQTRR
jgi:hypothetical protein